MGFIPCKAEHLLRGMELQEKEAYKKSVYKSQRKAFYKQRIPDSNCTRKVTVDIDILAASRDSDRPPSRIRK